MSIFRAYYARATTYSSVFTEINEFKKNIVVQAFVSHFSYFTHFFASNYLEAVTAACLLNLELTQDNIPKPTARATDMEMLAQVSLVSMKSFEYKLVKPIPKT